MNGNIKLTVRNYTSLCMQLHYKIQKMFWGHIFFEAIRDAYEKSEQNDKNAWMIGPTRSVLLLFSFFFNKKLTNIFEQYACKFFSFLQNLPAFFNNTLVNFAYIMQNLPAYC